MSYGLARLAGRAQVGADGAEAAWLIVQQAIGWPSLQRKALVTLQGAVARGDAPPLHAAMLEDRVRTLEGEPPPPDPGNLRADAEGRRDTPLIETHPFRRKGAPET